MTDANAIKNNLYLLFIYKSLLCSSFYDTKEPDIVSVLRGRALEDLDFDIYQEH